LADSCAPSTDLPGAPDPPGLYVHVPFCRSICPYCDFTVALTDPGALEALAEAVLAEARRRAPGLNPRTLYFGGGTPTELPGAVLARLVRELRGAGRPLEVAVEANPESVTPAKVAALLEAGAGRISLGVQSTRDSMLRTLGRNHSAAQARRAFETLRQEGVPSINVDLMFGLPGQTPGVWAETLQEILAWGPDHVSAYALELSPAVPMARRMAAGRLRPLPEPRAQAQYEQLCGALARAGFEHYEVSNFARAGHASHHNRGYWEGRPYVGLGPGAHSFDGVERSWNVRRYREYLRRIEAGESAREDAERLTPAQRRIEHLMLRLRTAGGWDFGEPGSPLGAADRQAALDWAREQNPAHVVADARGLRFTEAGFWYSQGLIADLLGRLAEA